MDWIILLVIFFGIFMLRNFLLPLFADDYSYAFIWDGKNKGNLIRGIGKRERVKSIKDILISQYSHYLTWSGRFVAHFFVQLFILIGKKFFNVINTLIFISVIFLIYWLGTGKVSFDFISFDLSLWILFCYWFCVPSLFITNLWLCGSCGYLFMAVLQCAFIMPYAINYFNPVDFNIVLAIILGFFAGFSNESGGAGVFFLTLILVINSFILENLASWQILGFLAFCIGYAILVIAPGNSVHIKLVREVRPGYIISEESFMKKEMFIRNFFSGFFPVTIRAWILFVPIIFYFFKNGMDFSGVYIAAFVASGFLSLLTAMIFSPVLPERAGYLAVIFWLIASVSAVKNINFLVPNWLKYFSIIILFSDMILCAYSDYDFGKQLKNIIQSLEEQKDKDLITVPQIRISKSAMITRWRALNEYAILFGSLVKIPESYKNIMFTQYYGYGTKKLVCI